MGKQLGLTFLFLVSTSVLANVLVSPKDASELMTPKNNRLVRIQGAEVAYADFAALKRDFPQLRALSGEAIKEWVLDNFAYISEAQLELNGIRQSSIPTTPAGSDKRFKNSFRPWGYHRAAVVEAKGSDGKVQGLIDIKGIGNREGSEKIQESLNDYRTRLSVETTPNFDGLRTKDHSDGLMSLGEAIAETSRQQAVQKLFDIHNAEHGTNFQTVESYFIISVPAKILKEEGQSGLPAALYGRQAHVGRTQGALFDMYGQGPAYPSPPTIYSDHAGNKQGDLMGSAVDFGGVMIEDSRLQKTFGDPKVDPQKSNAWRYAHDTALAYTRSENPDKNAIYQHLKTMLSPIEKDWSQAAAKLPPHKRLSYAEGVQAMLKSSDGGQRMAGLAALEGHHEPWVAPLLAQGLEDSSDYVRNMALRILPDRTDPQSLDLLVKYAESHDSQGAQRLVAFAIRNRSEPAAVALQDRILKAADPYGGFAYAIEALGNRSDEESLKKLRSYAKTSEGGSNPMEKTIPALRALQKRSREDFYVAYDKFIKWSTGVDELAFRNLLDMLDKDTSEEATKLLTELPRVGLRRGLIPLYWSLFSNRRDPTALKFILEKATQAGPHVRLGAIRALRGRQDPQVIQFFEELMENNSPIAFKLAAIDGLKEISTPRATELIAKFYREHPTARSETEKILFETNLRRASLIPGCRQSVRDALSLSH